MIKSLPASGKAGLKHQHGLEQDTRDPGLLSIKSKKRKARREDENDGFVDSKSSRKILRIGQELAEEDQTYPSVVSSSAFALESRFPGLPGSQEEPLSDPDLDQEAWGDEEEEVEELEIDPNDLDLFNKFVPPSHEPTLDLQQASLTNPTHSSGRNLADIILAQIAAHEASNQGQAVIHGGGNPEDAIEIPTKVVEVYSKVGLILSRYKSGKLPKPFKILPTMPQWEDLLAITRPESWTPNACYEATRIFTSANPYIGRRFLEHVVLEQVREDIRETKKLNVHLFNALRKATYKPAAFFKGFLFPLITSGTCTLREANIISGVLARASIPVLHSAAALMRLTDIAAEQASAMTEGGGATNVFIRTLLEKKYALPYKVIDNLVFHFLRFRPPPEDHHTRTPTSREPSYSDLKLPVIWHQSLLAFAQRYRNDITEDQREALLDLLLVRAHKDIGPEIRRELLAGRERGEVVQAPKRDDGDDTMEMEPT